MWQYLLLDSHLLQKLLLCHMAQYNWGLVCMVPWKVALKRHYQCTPFGVAICSPNCRILGGKCDYGSPEAEKVGQD